MKRKLYIVFIFLFVHAAAFAQDSVLQRIILIGDAGEMDAGQKTVIANAVEKILAGKTTVIYLGDNIYPTGMALPGTTNDSLTKEILRSQFVPMRSNGAAVYFVPGNHDWDRSGIQGLQKIKLQWQYLHNQNDPLLKLVPENGCPDPYEINVSGDLVIIAFDSEWWLYPFNKNNPGADCDCKTKDDVVAKMEELAYTNRYKIILLASHHPFQSYGRHGGYFSWKDHLFPFTAINKNLYIPLPVIGSLYPLLRRTFSNPEDLHHPLYKDMMKKIDTAVSASPNVIHAAGHEHTLQFIKGKQTQIVSGSGAKESYVRKKPNAFYTSINNGFVIADLLPGNNIRFDYYALSGNECVKTYSYIQNFTSVSAQEETAYHSISGDSINVQAHPSFSDNGKWHRMFFGENYRREYAVETTVPVIRISEIKGGLIPYKRGGGHQSRSLRLKDKDGKEWTLRSVDKYPEVLLPEGLRETFAGDWVKDAMSAQHPYAALVVPVIADAVNIPHANPIVGYVAPDKNLGIYSRLFSNTLCLLEEREPLGKSDNTAGMFDALNKDNDNSIDSTEFFRARLLDLFLGDWDRHEDQWRWADILKGKEKKYIAVPRDRDQVFHKTEGILPSAAARPWIAPFLHNFDGRIKKVNAFFFESRNMNGRFLNQFTHEQWMQATTDFINLLPDSILEKALQQLPPAQYQIRHEELLTKWKARRDNMAAAMDEYYFFFNKIIDIQTTDKNEFVEIKEIPGEGLHVSMYKLSKEHVIKEQFFSRVFMPGETKEIRLFLRKGDDSVFINSNSNIRLRIVGGDGDKKYNILNTGSRTDIYEKKNNVSLSGTAHRVKKHLSNDSLHKAFIPTNLYNTTAPLFTGGYNIDDGLLVGAGFKHIHHGFRKLPYASMQSFSIAHSFSTQAYRARYKAEWLRVFGKADFTFQASVFAPNNTQNFFGTGNETVFDKPDDYITYYRTRYSMYRLEPAFRWRKEKGTTFTLGTSFQYYHFDPEDNKNRFINNPSHVKTYDSLIIAQDKVHAGLVLNFIHDSRNNKLFPAWGSYINLRLESHTGLNKYSESFIQFIPEVALYKSINAASTFVIAERIGGLITAGKTAFYQQAYLGGHENLLGYHQYRFAGSYMLYNNIEARIKLADFASYILPGQIGTLCFFDAGRVWVKHESSGTWHTGFGGGIYFAPAQMAILQLVAGHSKEGWYPYISLGLRF